MTDAPAEEIGVLRDVSRRFEGAAPGTGRALTTRAMRAIWERITLCLEVWSGSSAAGGNTAAFRGTVNVVGRASDLLTSNQKGRDRVQSHLAAQR